MRGWGLCGFAAAVALASLETAYAQPPSQDAPVIETGVTSYTPDYFAEDRPTTAGAMVSLIPGFSIDFGGNARGFSSNVGNVLIDGRRPPSGNDGIGSVLGRIPADAVERIDIIRGGAAGIDMQGHPVVANVIRKPSANISGSVSVNGGVTERGDTNYSLSANASRRKDSRNLEGSASFNSFSNTSIGESARFAPDGAVLQQGVGTSNFSSPQYSLTAAAERPLLGGDTRVNLQYRTSTSENASRDELSIPGGVEESSGSGENEDGELGLRFTREFESGLKLEAIGLQELNDSTSEYRFNAAGTDFISRNFRRQGQTVTTGVVTLPPRGKWTFDGGAEVAYNWFETSSANNLNGTDTFIPGDELTVDELRTEAFATANWAPGPKLSGQFGLRFEHWTITAEGSAGSSEKTLAFVKPSASLAWRPRGGHEFSVSVERDISQLSFSDFATSVSPITGIIGASNTDLEPEKSWDLNARYQFNFANRGSFLAQLTHRRTSDTLGRTILRIPATPSRPEQLYDITANLGDEISTSAVVSLTLPLHRWGYDDTWFGFRVAGRTSEFLDPVSGEVRRISGESPYDWNLSLRQERNNNKFFWNIGVSGREGTSSYSPRSFNVSSGGLSVSGGVSFRPRDELSFGVNVFGSLTDSESRGILFTGPRGGSDVRWTTTFHAENPWQLNAFLSRRF